MSFAMLWWILPESSILSCCGTGICCGFGVKVDAFWRFSAGLSRVDPAHFTCPFWGVVTAAGAVRDAFACIGLRAALACIASLAGWTAGPFLATTGVTAFATAFLAGATLAGTLLALAAVLACLACACAPGAALMPCPWPFGEIRMVGANKRTLAAPGPPIW